MVQERTPFHDRSNPRSVGGTLWLDFHGVLALVRTNSDEVRDRVAKDFSYFLCETSPEQEAAAEYSVEANNAVPDWDALPELTATVQTPRNHCYTDGDVTYLDYHGSALGTYHRTRNHLDVVSTDIHRLHEIVYLSILSRVGELLERKGLHRVHALAVAHGGEAALFMMDSGGGKSTLGLGFLEHGHEFKMISEDSPLVDRKGNVHAFPLRIGVLPPFPDTVDEQHVYRLDRMEFDPKYLIATRAFPDRIGGPVTRPRHLFIGKRRLGHGCVIRPVSRLTGFKALLRHMVVGVGLYQGLEFLLRSSALDLIRGSTTFFGRLTAALRMLLRSKVYVAELGRDREHNLEQILAFLRAQDVGRTS